MQLTPSDAQMYWLSERICSDQFLLYCFEGDIGADAVRAAVRRRVARVGELRCRIREVPKNLDYPYWEPRDYGDDQVIEHRLADQSWAGLQAALGALVATSIDARTSPWRVHVFAGVRDAPRCGGPAAVVVFQVSHAFADGARATELVRALFGMEEPPGSSAPEPVSMPTMLARLLRFPVGFARLVAAGRRAAAAARALTDATTAGEIPAPAAGCPLVGVNTAPGDDRAVRMVVCPAEMFRGAGVTVTVSALTAISVALPRFLESRGEIVPDRLGAEVTIAVGATGRSRNNYRNAGVDLFVIEPDLCIRAARIADEIADRRTRLSSPLLAQRDSANDFVPAPLLKFGVDRYSLDEIPETVTGNTVVSSVNRGPEDLEIAGAPVVFSAGFPGLSPMMALTHGVYGLGETVTIGINSSPRAVPDLDEYEAMLREAIGEVAAALCE
ncbi:wax ester/triacylglycerol synthase domain-containing protein [Rhodococcus artemisiae]|uniref:Wax ester/triacylglycerol synthase family O-acyltransferase n=1 Tax=Rhodococcus artemisiae TaxID=714159 RepID=A0ABU7LH57_9NOCA|nr:wax ester/triacylglycerol synthase domain-containing protein [Rhodococcus artemisiae]MEE2060889.1 wax ester/triacylglycerol synthase family O-acyltransferase [Rhodococcus artemisiae]